MNRSKNPEYTYYAKIRSSGYYKLLVCGLLTLVAMYAHRYFPIKQLVVVPSPTIVAYIYMSESLNGTSVAKWIDEKALHWQCLVANDDRGYTCGFHIVMGGGQGGSGLDLSGYDSVKVDIDYSGQEQRVRVYLRNYEPGFSDIQNIETAKFNNVLIPIQFVNEDLVLQLQEFSVAEWWINTFQVPREFSQPNFEHVVAFGVDLTFPAPVGVHDFKLNKLVFEGLWISAERWYFSILMFWILVITVAGAIKLAALRRSIMLERIRLENLESQNSLLAEQSDKYKQLSISDHLTSMLNRQGVADYIEENFPAGANRLVSLIIIDIDHFKRINDTQGHDGGDKVLRKVAEVIKTNIRQADRVARWGGEEFAIILPDQTIEETYVVAEKLRSLIAMTRFEEFPELIVTASLGVGAHTCEDSFQHLFRRVDVALYQAKAQGRNRTVLAAQED